MEFKEIKDISTKKLILSVLNANDEDIVFALRSNEEVIKYIERKPLQNKFEGTEKTKELVNYIDNNESISWVIKLAEENRSIGTICLWNFSSDRKTAELGYDLLPEFHNKGIMSEAIKVVLEFGFQKLYLKKVEAYTSKFNKSSIALLEKHHFKYQKDRFDEGCPDNNIYSLSS